MRPITTCLLLCLCCAGCSALVRFKPNRDVYESLYIHLVPDYSESSGQAFKVSINGYVYNMGSFPIAISKDPSCRWEIKQNDRFPQIEYWCSHDRSFQVVHPFPPDTFKEMKVSRGAPVQVHPSGPIILIDDDVGHFTSRFSPHSREALQKSKVSLWLRFDILRDDKIQSIEFESMFDGREFLWETVQQTSGGDSTNRADAVRVTPQK